MQVFKNKRGLIFVEILIVVAIIGILAAVVIPMAIHYRKVEDIASQMAKGTSPLSREDWTYYKNYKQELDNRVKKEKKRISEEDEDDRDYQEYMKSFKR